MIVVVGPSGCGKSSLVRAGVLPVMATELGWWTLPAVMPGADPVTALARELTGTGRRLGQDWTLPQVRRRLTSDDHTAAGGGLVAVVEELLLAAPGGWNRRRLLLVLDQAEELLTLTPAEGAGPACQFARPGAGRAGAGRGHRTAGVPGSAAGRPRAGRAALPCRATGRTSNAPFV
jgi:hypothetical protein